MNPGTDSHWLSEIERSPDHALQFTDGNRSLIHRSKVIGINHRDLIEHVPVAGASQVEVGMIRQI
jgi:hypothetical protein